MNLKLIKRWKAIFNYLLEDVENRTCLISTKDGWLDEKFNMNVFECSAHTITKMVIGDDYAVYRKAQLDGFKLQSRSRGVWEDESSYLTSFYLPPENYRIKSNDTKWEDTLTGVDGDGIICKVCNNGAKSTLACIREIKEFNNKELKYKEGACPMNAPKSWDKALPVTVADLKPFQREGWIDVFSVKNTFNNLKVDSPEFKRYLYEICGLKGDDS